MPSRTQFGHPVLGVTELLTLATLQAIDVTENIPYQTFRLYDGSVAGAAPSVYYYHPTSTLAADGIFVIAPTTGAGRYLLAPNLEADISLPFAFGTADAAIVSTTPTNGLFLFERGYWEITTSLTGGTSSAIGFSTNASPNNTKGDLLGGASGDVAATLTAGKKLGTIGAKTVAGGVLISGGVGLRFDAITSAFTAGAGFAHFRAKVIANPGV